MEILSVSQANQFQPGSTLMACGFFAVAMLTSASPPGEAPIKSPGQVSTDALTWYAQYNGDSSSSNMDGMSLQQLYHLLTQVHWDYKAISMSAGAVRAELGASNPVVLAVEESSVFDLQLGRNPYPWNPIYNHVILATGLAGANFLCRDSASIQAPNTLRPGPRTYDAERLRLVSATACIPRFPMAGYVPGGWKDDGTVLRGPYGRGVQMGFRKYILGDKNWPPQRVALSDEIPVPAPLGGGTLQIFPDSILRWTPQRGVYQAAPGVLLNSILASQKGKINVTVS